MKEKEKDKPKFVLCPRCELNYMPTNDKKRKYCDICLAELNMVDPGILIPDEDAELEVLCPVCKVNYMAPDEEMCFLCAKENTDRLQPEDDAVDNWAVYVDAEEPLIDDGIEISLSGIEEEEEDEAFDDDDDTLSSDVDDFDDSVEYDDYDDDDSDDEEEDEDY